MAEFIINDWKFGLDTRKSELTSVPGTLETAVNCHITQGGEIEKRKSSSQTLLPTNSFGLEITALGLTVFGSVAQGSLSPALPAGFQYQRLQHPDGSTAMTQVISSCPFGNYAFVVAKFADNNIYPYYNGSIVSDFTAGLILASLSTNALIAAAAAALVNLTSAYTATYTPSNSYLDVFGSPLTSYFTDITKTTAAGTLVSQTQSAAIPSVPALAAVGNFSIQGGSANAGTNKISSVKVNNVTVTNASVDWSTSNEFTAAAIATSINTMTSSPDYTATSNGNTVSIYALATDGDGPNGYVVEVNAAGNVVIGICNFSLALNTGYTSFDITHVYVDGVDILTTPPVVWNSSISGTLTDLVTNINLNATYNAYHIGNAVFLSKRQTKSSDAPLSVLVNTTAGGVVTFGDSPTINASLSPTQLSLHLGRIFGYNVLTTAACTATVQGGVPPYFYQWQPAGEGSSVNIYALSPNSYSTIFSTYNPTTGVPDFPGQIHASFVCVITDSAGSMVSSPPVNVFPGTG